MLVNQVQDDYIIKQIDNILFRCRISGFSTNARRISAAAARIIRRESVVLYIQRDGASFAPPARQSQSGVLLLLCPSNIA